MKLTVNSAMRARDVSRPHDEHLAEAASAELLAEADAVAAEDGMAIQPESPGVTAGTAGTAIAETASAETASGGAAVADEAPRPKRPKRRRSYGMRRGR